MSYERIVGRFGNEATPSAGESGFLAAAEGEIARNLSGKRTADGATTLWKVGAERPCAEGVSVPTGFRGASLSGSRQRGTERAAILAAANVRLWRSD
jgi:hypothetical protein